MHPGIIGGIVGGLIGLAGAIAGTYFSIKNTNGPHERAFMVKVSIICWAAIIGYLCLLFVLPHPYRWFISVPFSILLPLGIIYINKKQKSIKQEELQNNTNSVGKKSGIDD